MPSLWRLLGLLVGHLLADSLLQPYWFAREKHPVSAARVGGRQYWPLALAAHAAIHAAFVWGITQSWPLALGEFGAHAFIDALQGRGYLSRLTDQGSHGMLKVVWWSYG